MSKFVVAPHFRLQEWDAEEKGYFAAEGLAYEFHETMDSRDARNHHVGNKVGAYQSQVFLPDYWTKLRADGI